MKKFSKILAVLLSLTIVVGMLAMFVSAEESTAYVIDSGNQLVVVPVKDGDTLVSGNYAWQDWEDPNAKPEFAFNQQMGDFAYTGANAILTNPQTGNRYLSFRRNLGKTTYNNGVGGYIEWNTGDWAASADSYTKGNMIGTYDYAVIDFDYGVDRYSMQVGHRVRTTTTNGVTTYTIIPTYRTYIEIDEEQVQKDIDSVYVQLLADVEKYKSGLDGASAPDKITLEEALETKSLAWLPGGNFYLGVRTNTDATTYDSAKNGTHTSPFLTSVKGPDGCWYLSSDSKYSEDDYKLPEEINEFVHLTYIFRITDTKAITDVFVDGNFIATYSSTLKAVMCVDGIRYQAYKDYKDEDIYGIAVDNISVNYYEKGYTSGSAFGIDDFFSSDDYKTTPLYNCVDVVYNANYMSANGYVQLDDANPVGVVPGDIEETLASVKDGSVLTVSVLDVLDFVVPDGVDSFSVYVKNGATFTLSDESKLSYLVRYNEDGSYLVRKPFASETVTINWIYKGTTLKTELLTVETMPDPSSLAYDTFDKATITLNYDSYVNWMFDIDGDFPEINIYDYEPIRPLTELEIQLIQEDLGGVLNIVTDEKKTESVVLDYFIGEVINGEFVLAKDSKGSYDRYTDISTLSDAIATASKNAIITINADVENFVIPEGFETLSIQNPNGKMFELAASDCENSIAVINADATVTVRPLVDADKITINWIDEDFLVKSYRIAQGAIPNVSSVIRNSFDFAKEELTISNYEGWYFDLGGEEVPVRALTRAEVAEIKANGGVINAYPATAEVEIYSLTEFVVGVYDENGNFVVSPDSKGGYSSYSDDKPATLVTEIENAASGSTVIFLYDGVLNIPCATKINISEGKTISIDIHGNTVTHDYGATTRYPAGLFMIAEDVTFNLYSSIPGGFISEAAWDGNTSSTSNKLVHGTGGIVVTNTGVTKCEINVGDLVDSEGNVVLDCGDNLMMVGGTFFKFNGSKPSTVPTGAALLAEKESKDIVLNIRGGKYYVPLRSSYGMIAVLTPGPEINVYDIEAYCSYTSYGFIHDYADGYASSSDLRVYNSTIISKDSDNKDFAKLYYRMDATSTAYFEGCTIIANLAQSLGGKMTFGPGNMVATSNNKLSSSYITPDGSTVANSKYAIDMSAEGKTISYTVTHSPLTRDVSWFLTDSAGKRYINPDFYNPDKFITAEKSATLTFITIDENNVPDFVSTLKWYDSDGSLLDTTYTLVGKTVEKRTLSDVASVDTDSKWYNLGFSDWLNETPGANSRSSMVALPGVNEFTPTGVGLVADIDAFENMAFWSHFSVNLLIPKETGIKFHYKGTGAAGTGFFEKTTSTACLTSNVGETTFVYNGEKIAAWYVQIWPNTNTYTSYDRTVRFIVEQYDLNGNGTIESNEKNIELSQTFTLNDLDYTLKVANTYECGSAEMKMVAAFVQYKHDVSVAMGPNVITAVAQKQYDEFFAILEGHGDGCACLKDTAKVEELFSEAEKAITRADYSELAYDSATGEGVILGAAYKLDLSKPALSLYITSDFANYLLNNDLDGNGKLGESNDMKKVFELSYIDVSTGKNSTTTTIVKPVADTFNGVACYRVDFVSICAYNITQIFTIKVNYDSKQYTGKYCLAEYIDNQPGSELARVYYNYAYTSKEFFVGVVDKYGISSSAGYGASVKFGK